MAGRRSVKIRRGHSAAAQRKRRAYIRISTARPCQGRSARVRRYRLWTRREAWPQTGQQASGAFGAVVMVTVSADGTTCWTSRPEGISGRMCLDKPVTGSTGCSCYVRIPHRFAHQRHQDCGRAIAQPASGSHGRDRRRVTARDRRRVEPADHDGPLCRRCHGPSSYLDIDPVSRPPVPAPRRDQPTLPAGAVTLWDRLRLGWRLRRC